MQTVLITGAGGFIGRHLAMLLTSEGKRVAGISRRQPPSDVNFADWLACDLNENGSPLLKFLDDLKPDAVIHLAATNFEPFAASNPWRVLQNNVQSALEILTACRQLAKRPRCVFVSSGAVYGQQPREDAPVDETCPLRPLTSYGVSKLAVEALALQHHRAFQVPAILVRPFNLTGPGEHASFVTSAFARQIALIEAGRQEPVIKAGDLTTTRDFMDVRDAARALAILAEVGQPGDVYNVCSDVPLRIDTLVSSLVGASRTQIEVRSEPSLMRVVEIRHQWGNSCKLRKATGWEPGYKLEQTLTDVLDDWRVRIQTEA